MVTSAAYRQSDRITPEKLEEIRRIACVSRGPRFRLDAEMIRDQALAASGLLVPKIGGPSVKPYQPPGIWEVVEHVRAKRYTPDTGDALYRRSLYTFWKRHRPEPGPGHLRRADARDLHRPARAHRTRRCRRWSS